MRSGNAVIVNQESFPYGKDRCNRPKRHFQARDDVPQNRLVADAIQQRSAELQRIHAVDQKFRDDARR